MNTDIPEVMRERARARVSRTITDVQSEVEIQRIALEDQLAALTSTTDGLRGAPQALWFAHQRSEVLLQKAAIASLTKVDRALALLQNIPDEPLTTAESERLADPEIALAIDDPAVESEVALESQQVAVMLKQLEIETASVAAVIANPSTDPASDAAVTTLQNELDTLLGEEADLVAYTDKAAELEAATQDVVDADPAADPTEDATVQTLQGELDAMKVYLIVLEADHEVQHRLRIDTWEVALPDRCWSKLKAYDTAIQLLNDVVAADIDAAGDALDAVEADLVIALQAVAVVDQANAFAQPSACAAKARAAFANDSLPGRLISAIRGDA